MVLSYIWAERVSNDPLLRKLQQLLTLHEHQCIYMYPEPLHRLVPSAHSAFSLKILLT